jgi:hypothetical protein
MEGRRISQTKTDLSAKNRTKPRLFSVVKKVRRFRDADETATLAVISDSRPLAEGRSGMDGERRPASVRS